MCSPFLKQSRTIGYRIAQRTRGLKTTVKSQPHFYIISPSIRKRRQFDTRVKQREKERKGRRARCWKPERHVCTVGKSGRKWKRGSKARPPSSEQLALAATPRGQWATNCSFSAPGAPRGSEAKRTRECGGLPFRQMSAPRDLNLFDTSPRLQRGWKLLRIFLTRSLRCEFDREQAGGMAGPWQERRRPAS